MKRVKPADPKVILKLRKLKGQKYTSSLSISNNAADIARHHKKVFDPHFTTKHEAECTGLGLYMSKTIIEKSMRGLISKMV